MTDRGSTDAVDDERVVELSTLSAIFPELVLDSKDPFSASLEILVNPASPLPVVFSPPSGGTNPPPGLQTPPGSSLADEDVSMRYADIPAPHVEAHHLSHLPPLFLRVGLPAGYPHERPPAIDLDSQSSWLPGHKVKELREAARAIWEDLGHDQVIYDYVDYLEEQAAKGFGLVDGKTALMLPQNLELALLDFDLKAKRKIFELETFDCGVCLEPKKGAICHRLNLCGHVMRYWDIQAMHLQCEQFQLVSHSCLWSLSI
jgi:E3 ubiquitin-protein ligase RNF14